jgi:hypothetical protein
MSFLVKVPKRHRDLIQAVAIKQSIYVSFYPMENNDELMQVEVHAENPVTLWYFATAYGMDMTEQIFKQSVQP